MTEHLRYMHVERFGAPDVEGIEVGECLVFPKLDGTNGSLWVGDDLNIYAGSRGRLLSREEDNHGFLAWVFGYTPGSDAPARLQDFFFAFPNIRLFGEWLVPHTFKHYREDAWRRFYVFDVWDSEAVNSQGGFGSWVPYDIYQTWLEEAALDFVPPIARVTNPTEDQLRKIAYGNTYLVADGAGPGEGVVVKRYDFVNRYGRTTWAKIVRNEFKDQHLTAMGVPEKGEVFQVEVAIAQEFVTPTLVAKERAKITSGMDTGMPGPCYDRAKLIPRLLETVYHCVVTEELWPALKKHKDPTIDFKKLRRYVIAQTKSLAKDLF